MAVGEYGITVDDARRDYRRFVNLGRLIKFISLLLFCIFAVWTVWYMNMPLERLSGMLQGKPVDDPCVYGAGNSGISPQRPAAECGWRGTLDPG